MTSFEVCKVTYAEKRALKAHNIEEARNTDDQAKLKGHTFFGTPTKWYRLFKFKYSRNPLSMNIDHLKLILEAYMNACNMRASDKTSIHTQCISYMDPTDMFDVDPHGVDHPSVYIMMNGYPNQRLSTATLSQSGVTHISTYGDNVELGHIPFGVFNAHHTPDSTLALSFFVNKNELTSPEGKFGNDIDSDAIKYGFFYDGCDKYFRNTYRHYKSGAEYLSSFFPRLIAKYNLAEQNTIIKEAAAACSVRFEATRHDEGVIYTVGKMNSTSTQMKFTSAREASECVLDFLNERLETLKDPDDDAAECNKLPIDPEFYKTKAYGTPTPPNKTELMFDKPNKTGVYVWIHLALFIVKLRTTPEFRAFYLLFLRNGYSLFESRLKTTTEDGTPCFELDTVYGCSAVFDSYFPLQVPLPKPDKVYNIVHHAFEMLKALGTEHDTPLKEKVTRFLGLDPGYTITVDKKTFHDTNCASAQKAATQMAVRLMK